MTRILGVSLWSDWECAGGTRTGDLRVMSGTMSLTLDNTDALSLVVEHDARVPVTVRSVVRIDDVYGDTWEFRVQSVGRTLRNGQRTVRGVPPIADLATAGLMWTEFGGVRSFDVGGTYSPLTHVDSFVLDNLAGDGLSWLGSGTITPTAWVSLNTGADGLTRLEYLKQLATLTNSELSLRRNGSTGYDIELTPIGASATPLHVALGKNLVSMQMDTDDGEAATAVTAMGGTATGFDGPATISENLWALGTIPGSAPYWIPLIDIGGGEGPIAFDDQCINCELLLSDATTLTITDSRASDSSVLVAATTGLVAGDYVQIVADSAGTRLTELSRPNTVRLHRRDRDTSLRGEANLARNGTLAQWASDDLPIGWGSTNGRRYPKNNPTTLTMTVAANAPDLTVVSISGGTPNEMTYLHDYWVVSGSISTTIRQTAAVNLDGSGAGSFGFEDLGGGTAIPLVAGDTLTLSTSTQLRPSSFGSTNGSADVIRFDSTGSGGILPTWRVKYIAGYPTINVAADITEVNQSGGDILAINCMKVGLFDVSGPTLMVAGEASSDLLDGTTRHSTLNTSTLLTADTSIAAAVLPIGVPSVGSYLVSVMVWLSATAAAIPPMLDGSAGSWLWKRANRALAARALTVNQIQVTVRDLSAAAGYSLTREQLVLGGDVVLDDIGQTVRIVGLTIPTTGDLGDVRVLLDSRPVKLIKFLAERF